MMQRKKLCFMMHEKTYANDTKKETYAYDTEEINMIVIQK